MVGRGSASISVATNPVSAACRGSRSLAAKATPRASPSSSRSWSARGDAVAPASYADESGGWALEVAGERRLDGGPPHRFAQESFYARVHVASLHRAAFVDEHLRDRVDDSSSPWMRGGECSAKRFRSARSTALVAGIAPAECAVQQTLQ